MCVSVYVSVCMCVSVYVRVCMCRQGNVGFVSAAEVGLFLKAILYLSCCLLVKSHTVSPNLS